MSHCLLSTLHVPFSIYILLCSVPLPHVYSSHSRSIVIMTSSRSAFCTRPQAATLHVHVSFASGLSTARFPPLRSREERWRRNSSAFPSRMNDKEYLLAAYLKIITPLHDVIMTMIYVVRDYIHAMYSMSMFCFMIKSPNNALRNYMASLVFCRTQAAGFLVKPLP